MPSKDTSEKVCLCVPQPEHPGEGWEGARGKPWGPQEHTGMLGILLTLMPVTVLGKIPDDSPPSPPPICHLNCMPGCYSEY